MYGIRFKDGTNIAVYSRNNDILNDEVKYYAGRGEFHTRTNALITVSDSNGLVNTSIDGLVLEDFDGNIWSFSVSGRSVHINIMSLSGDETDISFSIYEDGSAAYTFFYCNSKDEDGAYNISIGRRRPTFGSTRTLGSAGGRTRILANYLNGENGEYTYSGDIAEYSSREIAHMANAIVSNKPFPDISAYYKRYTSGTTTEENILCGIYTNGSAVYSGIKLSESSIREIKQEAPDPYAPGGYSSTGGGTGSFSGTGDSIEIPSVPTLSSADTGFITLFNPTIQQLKSLANYMWSNPLFDLDAWKKIFADPMDAILGLSIVPVAVPDGGTKAVTVGNISTGVTMNTAASQYVEVDCGTLNVEEYWGAYLDYSPYTKAEIYLPYIGTHAIKTDDIMGKAVHVVYHVDILSGSCVAFVKCGDSVLYTFIGQCSSSIPITGDNWTNVINGALNIAASIGTMVATGGLSAPMMPPGVDAVAGAASVAAANRIGLGSGVAQDVMSMKPEIEKSGAMGGTGGMLAVQTPYLILTRPNQCLPESQNSLEGYPSFVTVRLSELSGYTRIYAIHLDNITATQEELIEIENFLKEGVIF